MKQPTLHQYAHLQDVPWPKGHVYLYDPDHSTALFAACRKGCAALEWVTPDTRLLAQPGHVLMATGGDDDILAAKQMALACHLPLICLPLHYACLEAMRSYVVSICPTPTVECVDMQSWYVGDLLRPYPNQGADLYAALAETYYDLYDRRTLALWQNEPTAPLEAMAGQVRRAMLDKAFCLDPAAPWRLLREALAPTPTQIDWFLALFSLYKGQQKPYNQYRFEVAMCLAWAIRLSPNTPPVALPPCRAQVLAKLRDKDVRLDPTITAGADHRRRDWIWQRTLDAKAYYADLERMCDIHRTLLPDCGWGRCEGLQAWDLLHLLPEVAELAYADSALGHLYMRGDLNAWV